MRAVWGPGEVRAVRTTKELWDEVNLSGEHGVSSLWGGAPLWLRRPDLLREACRLRPSARALSGCRAPQAASWLLSPLPRGTRHSAVRLEAGRAGLRATKCAVRL